MDFLQVSSEVELLIHEEEGHKKCHVAVEQLLCLVMYGRFSDALKLRWTSLIR